jgi:polycystin 1L2
MFGQVDRLISIAGEEDKKQFKYLFNTAKSQDLRDGHLWFSVFLRPPRSRFTRVQRVSSCMALLYLSMLANAMWYGTVPETPGGSALKLGPFALSPEQVRFG